MGAVPPDVVDHDLGVLRGGRTGSNQQIASSTDGCLPVGGRCLQPNCRHGKDVSQVDHSRILRRRRNETVQCTAAPIPDTGGVLSPPRSGRHLFPLIASIQHRANGLLGSIDGVIGSPPALHLVGGRGGVEIQDVA